MLIEDEPQSLVRYNNYINSYDGNFEVAIEASTYKQALDQFNINAVDAIFTDIVIPGGSGLQFIEKIREMGYKGVVVVVSGYDNFTYAQKAIKLGASDYLLKPIFKSDYFTMLDKIMNRVEGRNIVENKFYSEKLPQHVRKAMKYVERNYEREIILSEVAQVACVSSAYLSSSFTKTINITFVEFVKYYRVEVAANLLENVDLTLEEIAEKVGFCDNSYLNRCFKKIKDVSPGKYRTEIIKKIKNEK
jgi:YesN/AraC family two-component response regulator